ncbi:MAG: PaaI family thioesterase [Coriobacteriales bacterium]
MPHFDSMDELRAFFAKDGFATLCLGAQVDSFEENPYRSQVSMTLDQSRHCNAQGFVMGGVFMALCDFALAVCSNTNQVACCSTNHNIEMMSRAKGQRLIAKAECTKCGRTLSFYEVNLFDELGTHVARMTATTMRTPQVDGAAPAGAGA